MQMWDYLAVRGLGEAFLLHGAGGLAARALGQHWGLGS